MTVLFPFMGGCVLETARLRVQYQYVILWDIRLNGLTPIVTQCMQK